MKLRKVKSEAEARAAMIADTGGRPHAEFTVTDGNFTAVRIGQLHIGAGAYSSGITLNRETPFDPASRYRVTAKAKGFADQIHYFSEYAEATAKRDSYDAGTHVEISGLVDVLVDESGAVVREVGTDNADEITF